MSAQLRPSIDHRPGKVVGTSLASFGASKDSCHTRCNSSNRANRPQARAQHPPHHSRSSSHYESTGGSTKTNNARYVWFFRVVFLLTLLIVATTLGFLTHRILTEAETSIARQQFDALAKRSVISAADIVDRKQRGAQSMATTVSHLAPDADAYPFVIVPGFEAIATDMVLASSGRELGFCPFVTPAQAADFENFAYTYYNTTRKPEPFPPGTATSSFGRGIWGVSPTLNTSDNRYHDVSGETYYESPNKLMVPILQHNEGLALVLLLNVHFQETRGRAIDSLIACSNQTVVATGGSEQPPCQQITDILILASQGRPVGPGALILHPIHPANDPLDLTGVLASSIVWDEVLVDIFPKTVSGIHCVLESKTDASAPSPLQTYTYYVKNGAISLVGETDLHSSEYDQYAVPVELTPNAQFSDTSPLYTLTLYPTEEFFAVYATNNPFVATLGAVFIILFTSILFVLYDYLVRREFTAKTDLLEAKRRFMAYVSHEVRTPLNSLCLGLALIQDEMTSAIGIDPTAESSTGTSKCATKGLAATQTLDGADERVPTVDSVESSNVLQWLDLTSEVFRNAESAVDVLTDLLNYDKIEMGKLNLELTLVDIWDLIRETVGEFKLQASRKKIDIVLDFSALHDMSSSDEEATADIPLSVLEKRVVGDKLRILQSLRNLVSNAVKFTSEQGSVLVNVQWSEQPDDSDQKLQTFKLHGDTAVSLRRNGNIEVAVFDNGAGMSPDQLTRLFTDGVQFNVNKLQAGQGSGLGLFITKGIVEQHGGSLTVQSEGLGQGTTFRLSLPLFHQPISERCKTVEESESDGYDPKLTGRRNTQDYLPMQILVVDDSEMNLKLLTRILRNKGHQCTTASNGLEACKAVEDAGRENQFDTILLDYEMPELNGPETATKIRSFGCDSFIVGITGNVMPEETSYFLSCGVNHVLAKPFLMPVLENIWVEYGVSARYDSHAENLRAVGHLPIDQEEQA